MNNRLLWWLIAALTLAVVATAHAQSPTPSPSPAARLRWGYSAPTPEYYQARVNGTPLPTFAVVTPIPTPDEYEQIQGPIRATDRVTLQACSGGLCSVDSNMMQAQTYTPTMTATMTPTSSVTATPTTSTLTTIWGPTQTPVNPPPDTDAAAIEVGVKFRSDVAGSITALRFYKNTTNTGLHVGTLWTLAGVQLASVTFTNETASGWQQANLPAPVGIAPDTAYVASYHMDTGHYAASKSYFTVATDNPPLHALADGASGPNGVFLYGGHAFPTNTFAATNYWVDVVFSSVALPTLTPGPTNTPMPAPVLRFVVPVGP